MHLTSGDFFLKLNSPAAVEMKNDYRGVSEELFRKLKIRQCICNWEKLTNLAEGEVARFHPNCFFTVIFRSLCMCCGCNNIAR